MILLELERWGGLILRREFLFMCIFVLPPTLLCLMLMTTYIANYFAGPCQLMASHTCINGIAKGRSYLPGGTSIMMTVSHTTEYTFILQNKLWRRVVELMIILKDCSVFRSSNRSFLFLYFFCIA